MARIVKQAGTEHAVVGKVFILYGTVQAVSPDGTVRLLAPNSPIFADDRIITGGDGSISIQFDGPPVTQLDLGRMTEIVVDQDVYAGVTPEAVTESAAEAEQVQQSLAEGTQEIDLEATAAGGSHSSGGGHPVVTFTLDGNQGYISTAGADSSGIAGGAAAGTVSGVYDVGGPSIPRVDLPVDTTVTNGSAISTTLSVQAGDVVTFSWSFDTDDAVHWGNDFAFVVVNGGVAKLADVSQVGDDNATGWGTVTFTAINTGDLQIGFGVMNTGDESGNSHLLIDNLTVNGKTVQSFESGLAGWSTIGEVAVVPGHDEGGETPVHGTSMVQITTTPSTAYEADLQTFFHDLPEGALSAASATRLGQLAWATVDDEGLQQGITGDEVGGQGGHGDVTVGHDAAWNEATFNGWLPLNFGPDGPGSVGFSAMNGQTGMVGTEQVTYQWDVATHTLTATGPRGALFTVEVDPLSGHYALTLQDNILHSAPTAGQEAYENNAYVQQLTYTVTDTDGDHVNGTLNILINDDMPGANLARATDGKPLEGTLPFGADGPGHVLSIAGTGTANTDDTYIDGLLTVTGKEGGTLKVDSNSGHYLYTPPGVLPKGDVTETFDFKLMDGDGDSADAQLAILIDDPTNNPNG